MRHRSGQIFPSILLILFSLGSLSHASTYYIDCQNSLGTSKDSNSGTSKSAAWVHHPYMNGFTGSYAHSSGDRFIFRGGTDCPNSYLPLSLQAGGSSGNSDYYGVDTTWYAGSASGTVNTNGTQVMLVSGTPFDPATGDWAGNTITINGNPYTISSVHDAGQLYLTTSAGTQTGASYSASLFVLPQFDAQGSTISGSSTGGTMVLSQYNYVTFDHIRLTNYYWQGQPGSGGAIIINIAGSVGFELENSIVDNWSHDTYAHCGSSSGNCDNAKVIFAGGGPATNWTLSHDTFGQCYGSSTCGDSMQGGIIYQGSNGTIDSSTCFNTQGCFITFGTITISNNLLYNVAAVNDYDPGGHADAMQIGTDVNVYNNVFHDISTASNTTAFPLDFAACASSLNNVYNNVFWNISTQVPIVVDSSACGGSNNSGGVANIWNNTIAANGGFCTRIVNRSGSDVYGTISLQNNHCVGTLYTKDSGTTINSFITTPNTIQTQSQANSQGYTTSTGGCASTPLMPCQPTAATNSTVGAGNNLNPDCSAAGNALCNTTSVAALSAPSSRPASSPPNWDAGAFLWGGEPSQPNPPTNLTSTVQ